MRVALLLALLLLPPAAAAPAEGALTFEGPVRVRGQVEVSSPVGVLDLTELVRAGGTPDLSWTGGRGRSVLTNWTTVRASELSYGTPQHTPETLPPGPGRLASLSCGEGCLVLVVGLGGEGTRVAMAGARDGLLSTSGEGKVFWANYAKDGQRNAFSLKLPPGAFRHAATEADLAAEGRVGLLARNAVAVLEYADGTRRTVDARLQRDATTDPLGLATASQVRGGFVHLEMEGALLRARGPATLHHREGTLRADGVLDATRAAGSLDAGRARVQLHGDALRIEGAWTLALDAYDPERDDGPRGRFQGDVASLALGGAPVRVAAAAPVSPWAQLALFALLALGALYTRIARSAVLDHGRRRALLEAVHAQPGSTATTLARATGMSRVLAQYHLRMLRANAIVAARPDGRQTRWYAPEAAPDSEALALAHALGEETRRRLALHVLHSPDAGLTQQDLARHANVSQRLASYHLARLEASGLVRCVGRRPQRYVPTPRLAVELASGRTTQANDIAT